MIRDTRLMILGWLVCVLALTLGCTDTVKNDADSRQAAETKKRLSEADRQIGMPDITRFTERKLARDILELRDKEITTYCYIVNLHGKLVFIGEAIGFGLPYSVQYTNPNRIVDGYDHIHHSVAGIHPTPLPQADPNGLYMPEGLSATWIMLKGPDGKPRPVYMEPEIIVSPFPLHTETYQANGEVDDEDIFGSDDDGPIATETN